MGIIKAAKLAFDYLRYDEDGNGSYYKRMQAYVQRNLKNTQNLDDRITKKRQEAGKWHRQNRRIRM